MTIDVPAGWADAAAAIAGGELRRVMVLGAPDQGKSVLCRFLLREAVAASRRAACLDADLGQKLVGPPACVTMGMPAAADGLAPTALTFIGTTNPLGDVGRTVQAVVRFGRTPADLLLANTDGFLAGPGSRLKARLIRAFRPDLLLALGEEPALVRLLADHPGVRALRLVPSPLARRKTEGERRAARSLAFRAHFEGAVPTSVPLGGDEPHGEVPPRLLVGLADAVGRDLALGILLGTEAGAATVLTTADPGRVRRVRLGAVILDEGFRDRLAQARTRSPRGS